MTDLAETGKGPEISTKAQLAAAQRTIGFLRSKLGCIAAGEFESLERCSQWAKDALLTENFG